MIGTINCKSNANRSYLVIAYRSELDCGRLFSSHKFFLSLHPHPLGISSYTDFELGLMTCFDQWDNIKHKANRDLKSTFHWGLPSLVLLGILPLPWKKD